MNVCSKTCRKAMIISRLGKIGPAKLKKILLHEDLSMSPERLAERLSLYTNTAPEEVLRQIFQNEEFAEHQIDEAVTHDAHIICTADNGYPELLKESKFDPGILFVKGNLGNHLNSAAVIGSRELPPRYDQITARITGNLVAKGVSIVSGLAVGCDSYAHKTAIAEGGHTVAVLGHGLDSIYPKENAGLAEDIISSGGALVSQFQFGSRMNSYNFAKRDLVQAGLSRFVLMIASGVPGGSLIASGAALEDGRDLFVPAPIRESVTNDKVRANNILVGENPEEICRILKLKRECFSPGHLHIIKDRNDYGKFDDFISGIAKADGDGVSGQLSLF